MPFTMIDRITAQSARCRGGSHFARKSQTGTTTQSSDERGDRVALLLRLEFYDLAESEQSATRYAIEMLSC
jgi:hypothetical protein